jgi:hypothetical protein
MAFFTGELASATITADCALSVVKWDLAQVRCTARFAHGGQAITPITAQVRRLSLSKAHSEEAHAFQMLPSMFCR